VGLYLSTTHLIANNLKALIESLRQGLCIKVCHTDVPYLPCRRTQSVHQNTSHLREALTFVLELLQVAQNVQVALVVKVPPEAVRRKRLNLRHSHPLQRDDLPVELNEIEALCP
jgi:hypothetical protein